MPKILIIEDEVDLAEIYKTALTAADHEIVGIFATPPLAMAPGTPMPDLILLDERLQGLSGSRFIGDLKKRFPGARIVMATADAEVAIAAESLGAIEGKLKPFSMRHLVENIDGLFRA
jgi:DNA-binding NtrC family response regulator